MSKEDQARAAYSTLCQTLDNMKWNYKKEEKNGSFNVYTRVNGKNGIVMKLNIAVEPERSVMYIKSPLDFIKVPPERRDNVAIAITRINWTMLDGCFEMNCADRLVNFKMVKPFMDSTLGTESIETMIVLVCQMVDAYNTYILDVSSGRMTIAELEEALNKK